MNRELTTREKTLLLVLAVLVIALGYWKLVLEPINEQVASYNDMAEQEQAEIDSSVVQLAQMRKMQKAVEAQKEAGEVRAIPSYDNSGILMRELYQILANTNEYTVDFPPRRAARGISSCARCPSRSRRGPMSRRARSSTRSAAATT